MAIDINQVGELVVTQPLPSMPPYFWGDTEHQRYLGSYFDMFPPGKGRRTAGGDADATAVGVGAEVEVGRGHDTGVRTRG